MVFNTFKEDIVESKGWATAKEIKKFAIRLALLMFTLSLAVGLVVYSCLGGLVVIAFFALMGFAFVALIDWSDEEESNFKLMQKVSKFWWVGIILIVLSYVGLKYMQFI